MCLNPLYVKGNKVPCRKCVECKIQYSNEWAYRVMLEAKKHEHNCFITLTYNDDNLPDKASLKKRDFQKFMKRLRKYLLRFAIKVRYFACGEYGSKGNRPHYHCILFGYDFPDKYFFCRDNRGNNLYRSPVLEKIWQFGFSSVGEELDFDSAKYCAKYMQADLDKQDGREKPFTLMSRKPGIALDVIPKTVYDTGDIYFNGRKVFAPRAFLKKFKNEFPEIYVIVMSKKLSKLDWLQMYCKTDLYDSFTGLYQLYIDLCKQESFNFMYNLEERRKKYKKIFDKNLDNQYRLMVSLKSKGTVCKST